MPAEPLPNSDPLDAWSRTNQADDHLLGLNPLANASSDPTYFAGKKGDSRDSISEKSSTQKPLRVERRSARSRVHATKAHEHSGQGRYQELEEIGRGGCGVVIRAFDRQIQRYVVIKRILPNSKHAREYENRFINEARITGQLEHPGIVPVHELGLSENGSLPFYAMKWLQGSTLASVLNSLHQKRTKGFGEREIRPLVERFHQVCQTLAYAHQMGVIHRDLKPANIFIGQFGETVVLDWGLAKRNPIPSRPEHSCHDGQRSTIFTEGIEEHGIDAIDEDDSSAIESDGGVMSTQPGRIMGTAAYMSPEQARGDTEKISFPSDVFSLGCILYEILVGKSPFRSSDTQSTIQAVIETKLIPIRRVNPKIPRSLAAICEKALARDPSLRYSDAQSLAMDVQSYLSGDSVQAYAEPLWVWIDRMAGKHRTLVRSIFGAMVVTTCIALYATAVVSQANNAERVARKQAEKETRDKAFAFEREKIAHQETLVQAQAARSAVDAWLIELSGDLQFYPGLAPIRKQLLQQAKDYYAELCHRKTNSLTEVLERVKSQLRLGDLERLLGNHREAENFYGKADDELAGIVETSERETESWRVQEVNVLLGFALNRLEGEGAMVEVALSSLEALSAAIELRNEMPDSGDVQNVWIRANQVHARSLALNSKANEAASWLSRPIMTAKAIAMDGTPRERRLLATLLEDQARYYEQAGQWKEAMQGYQDVIEFYGDALRTASRPDWLESRAHAHLQRGACALRSHQAEKGVEEFQSAKLDFQAAWDLLYGEPILRENVAITDANLGLANLKIQNLEIATNHFRDSIEALQWLVRREGADEARIMRMAQCFLGLATALEDRNPEEKSSLLRDAERLIAHLEQNSKLRVPTRELRIQWEMLAISHGQALSRWEEAMSLANRVIDRELFPEEGERTNAWHLVRVLLLRSALHWELKELEESHIDFALAEDWYRGLVDDRGDRSEW